MSHSTSISLCIGKNIITCNYYHDLNIAITSDYTAICAMIISIFRSRFELVHRRDSGRLRLALTFGIAVPAWLGWGMAGLQYMSSYQTLNKYGTLLVKVSVASAVLGFNYAFTLTVSSVVFPQQVQIVVGRGEDAKCQLCDAITSSMLDSTTSIEDIDCGDLCPFRINSCVKICEKIIGAVKGSAGYPCIAVKMCPEIDEFGEIPR
jgi:hypothetical protein